MNFTIVGFDIRIWPRTGVASVEDGNWEINEEVFDSIKREFGIEENSLQLLEITDQHTLDNICNFVELIDEATIVAMELPKQSQTTTNFPESDSKLSLSRFTQLGYDICDIQGFFSVLTHPKVLDGDGSLIPIENIDTAIAVYQQAESIDRQHSPYFICRLSSLEKNSRSS